MKNFEYIKDILKRNIIGIAGVLFGVVSLSISIGLYMYDKKNFDKECEAIANEVQTSDVIEQTEEPAKTEVKTVKVDIKGAVKKPGVYELEETNTVMDALTKAGGLTSKGTSINVNLSKRLKDEMVIYFFTKAEIEARKTVNEVVCEVPKCECETIVVEECTSNNNTNTNSTDKKEDTPKEETNKKVSINTGSLEELTTLNGIGEAKAKSIIEYREKNGPFKALEDIKNVSGIGEAAFEKIKDNIEL